MSSSPSPRSTGPAPLTILVIGVGSIGERHLRCLGQLPGVRTAFVEPLESRRLEVAARCGVDDHYASLDDACRRDWDGAVVCTPANLHVGHAVRVAPHCRGLMIEKPLATDPADVPRLRAAVAGKPVQVAYVYRVHPGVEQARRLLDEGSLGPPLEATVVAGQHFPTYRPAYREIYYADRRTGGGAVQDAMTHTADVLQYLVGRFDWVFCDYAHQALEGVEVEDTVHLTGRARGGKVLVSIALNQFMAPNQTRIQVNCRGGSLQVRSPEHRFGTFRHGDSEWQWSEPLLGDRDEWFRRQAQRFLDVLAGRATPSCSLDDAAHTLEINVAALKSAGTRRIELSPTGP